MKKLLAVLCVLLVPACAFTPDTRSLEEMSFTVRNDLRAKGFYLPEDKLVPFTFSDKLAPRQVAAATCIPGFRKLVALEYSAYAALTEYAIGHEYIHASHCLTGEWAADRAGEEDRTVIKTNEWWSSRY